MIPRIRPAQQRAWQRRAVDLAPLVRVVLRPLRGRPYTEQKAALFLAFDLALIESALERHDRVIADTADALGMPRQSLQCIMKKRGFKGAPRRRRK